MTRAVLFVAALALMLIQQYAAHDVSYAEDLQHNLHALDDKFFRFASVKAVTNTGNVVSYPTRANTPNGKEKTWPNNIENTKPIPVGAMCNEAVERLAKALKQKNDRPIFVKDNQYAHNGMIGVGVYKVVDAYHAVFAISGENKLAISDAAAADVINGVIESRTTAIAELGGAPLLTDIDNQIKKLNNPDEGAALSNEKLLALLKSVQKLSPAPIFTSVKQASPDDSKAWPVLPASKCADVTSATPNGYCKTDERVCYFNFNRGGVRFDDCASKIGNCAGSKIVKHIKEQAANPICLAEVYLQPDFSLKDYTYQRVEYNKNDKLDLIPSCTTCQYVIPKLMA